MAKQDQCYTKNGRKYKKKTTAGWELEVEWKDGSTSWVPLKPLKESNAIDVAVYARNNQIMLKKEKRLIKKMKTISIQKRN
jgi:hypothetical protein